MSFFDLDSSSRQTQIYRLKQFRFLLSCEVILIFDESAQFGTAQLFNFLKVYSFDGFEYC